MIPDVTIMIPTFNVGEYVSQALDSALGQTFSGNYEIVVVDDGSTDGTLGILNTYQGKNPNKIKVISQKHQGVSAARNRILDNSSGEVIVNLDSDDTLHPSALEKVVGAFRENSKVSFVYSDHVEIDEAGNHLEDRRKGELHEFFNDLIFHCYFPVHINSFRRSAIGNKRYDTSLQVAEDYDFALGLLLPENPRVRVGYIPEIIYSYRINKKGLGNTVSEERKGKDTRDVVKRYLTTNKIYGEDGRYISVESGRDACFILEHKLEDAEIEMDPKARKVLMEFVGWRAGNKSSK